MAIIAVVLCFFHLKLHLFQLAPRISLDSVLMSGAVVIVEVHRCIEMYMACVERCLCCVDKCLFLCHPSSWVL